MKRALFAFVLLAACSRVDDTGLARRSLTDLSEDFEAYAVGDPAAAYDWFALATTYQQQVVSGGHGGARALQLSAPITTTEQRPGGVQFCPGEQGSRIDVSFAIAWDDPAPPRGWTWLGVQGPNGATPSTAYWALGGSVIQKGSDTAHDPIGAFLPGQWYVATMTVIPAMDFASLSIPGAGVSDAVGMTAVGWPTTNPVGCLGVAVRGMTIRLDDVSVSVTP